MPNRRIDLDAPASLSERTASERSVAVTAEFFADRRARADFKGFDRLMKRKGGEAPRNDDKID